MSPFEVFCRACQKDIDVDVNTKEELGDALIEHHQKGNKVIRYMF